MSTTSTLAQERLSKIIARSGIASRREADALIKSGCVSVNGKKVTKPSEKGVAVLDDVVVDGFGILPKAPPSETLSPATSSGRPRIWQVYKLRGELVASKDRTKQRPLLFDRVKKITKVGIDALKPVDRMEFNTEGLALVTNNGSLSRVLNKELSTHAKYRVRVHGLITMSKILALQKGIFADGVKYMPLEVNLDRQNKGTISWLTLTAKETNAKAIKSVFEKMHLRPLRIIRTEYGPFSLAGMPNGSIREVSLPALLSLKWKSQTGG